MEILIALVILSVLTLAAWRGITVDSRDNQNWDPAAWAQSRGAARYRTRPNPRTRIHGR